MNVMNGVAELYSFGPPLKNGLGVLIRTSSLGLDKDFTVCCMSSPSMRRFDRNLILIY